MTKNEILKQIAQTLANRRSNIQSGKLTDFFLNFESGKLTDFFSYVQNDKLTDALLSFDDLPTQIAADFLCGCRGIFKMLAIFFAGAAEFFQQFQKLDGIFCNFAQNIFPRVADVEEIFEKVEKIGRIFPPFFSPPPPPPSFYLWATLWAPSFVSMSPNCPFKFFQ